MTEHKTIFTAADVQALPEEEARHPLNPESRLLVRSLGDAAGLTRVGFHLCRVPPGAENMEVHTHLLEEEFFYVLEGRAVAWVDGEEHEVGPGDFLAFPTPSVGHGLRNPFEDDFVYLAGGERREVEIAEFPRRGKLLVRTGERALLVDRDAMEDLR